MSIKHYYIVPLIALLLVLFSCERKICDVPSYPVQFDINLIEYPYPTRFAPGVGYQTIAITMSGTNRLQLTFPTDTILINRKETDYVGYAGMVVWSDMENRFHAADLCCPHCLLRDVPVHINGAFAECPTCGERWDLMSGYATPQKGITKQTLRTFQIRYSNWYIHIQN